MHSLGTFCQLPLFQQALLLSHSNEERTVLKDELIPYWHFGISEFCFIWDHCVVFLGKTVTLIMTFTGLISLHPLTNYTSCLVLFQLPWFPEVFLFFPMRELRSSEKEKPLVTLDLNLTFMQTPGSGSDPRALIG